MRETVARGTDSAPFWRLPDVDDVEAAEARAAGALEVAHRALVEASTQLERARLEGMDAVRRAQDTFAAKSRLAAQAAAEWSRARDMRDAVRARLAAMREALRERVQVRQRCLAVPRRRVQRASRRARVAARTATKLAASSTGGDGDPDPASSAPLSFVGREVAL